MAAAHEPEHTITRSIELHAPPARVWRALTDHREFGAWFKVAIEQPFTVGEESRGHITYPGYEHVLWRAVVREIVPEQLFAFTWHPYAVDPNHDYSAEPPTRVEFRLEAIAGGTRLTVTESGFEHIPADRRHEAFVRNSGGWSQQVKNIAAHLGAAGA